MGGRGSGSGTKAGIPISTTKSKASVSAYIGKKSGTAELVVWDGYDIKTELRASGFKYVPDEKNRTGRWEKVIEQKDFVNTKNFFKERGVPIIPSKKL